MKSGDFLEIVCVFVLCSDYVSNISIYFLYLSLSLSQYYPSRAFGLKRSDFSHQKGLGKPLTIKNIKHILSCYWWKPLSFPPGWETGRRWGRNCAALIQHKPIGKACAASPAGWHPEEHVQTHTNTCMLWHQQLCACVCVCVGGGWSLL